MSQSSTSLHAVTTELDRQAAEARLHGDPVAPVLEMQAHFQHEIEAARQQFRAEQHDVARQLALVAVETASAHVDRMVYRSLKRPYLGLVMAGMLAVGLVAGWLVRSVTGQSVLVSVGTETCRAIDGRTFCWMELRKE